MVQLELSDDEHLIGSSGGLQPTIKTHSKRHSDRKRCPSRLLFLDLRIVILKKLVGSNFLGLYFDFGTDGLYMQRWHT